MYIYIFEYVYAHIYTHMYNLFVFFVKTVSIILLIF